MTFPSPILKYTWEASQISNMYLMLSQSFNAYCCELQKFKGLRNRHSSYSNKLDWTRSTTCQCDQHKMQPTQSSINITPQCETDILERMSHLHNRIVMCNYNLTLPVDSQNYESLIFLFKNHEPGKHVTLFQAGKNRYRSTTS